MTAQEQLGGPSDAHPGGRRHSFEPGCEIGAAFHLNKRQPFSATRHKIDLSHPGAIAPG